MCCFGVIDRQSIFLDLGSSEVKPLFVKPTTLVFVMFQNLVMLILLVDAELQMSVWQSS